MKKVILALIFAVIQFTLVFSQIRDTSNEHRKNLIDNENIKSNKIRVMYKAKVRKQSDNFDTGILVMVDNYDSQGRLKKQISYEEYEDSTHTEYDYYPDGYIKTKKVTSASSQPLISNYTYDSLGRYVSIKNTTGEYRDYEFVYDNKGNLIKKLGYTFIAIVDDNGKVNESEKVRTLVDEHNFKYDKKFNLIEESFINKKQLFYTSKFKYDKKGNRIETSTVYLGNKVKYIYKYDDKNKLSEEIKFNIDGTKTYFKYSYEFY